MGEGKKLFKPGESGNPNGRPKGAKNRTTAELRQHIQTVLDGQYEKLESDLNAMNPFQRVMMAEKLTKYFLPALAKNENDTNVTGEINIRVSYSDDAPDAISDNEEGEN